MPLAYATGGASWAFARSGLAAQDDGDALSSGMIIRERGPDNLEMPFSSLDGFLTPNERFYVRSHFEVPTIEPGSWRLKVEGEVEHPFELTYDELRRMPSTSITSLLECSGNGRIFLDPPQLGIRWELGGVGNAKWTGIPLATLLERAGVKPGAVDVILEGADSGKFAPPQTKSPGEIPYARSLPLEKARQPEVLLAYQMNGEDLPPRHGFPARVVVSGWYGMASVKWLSRIIVTNRPFQGYFQTMSYVIWERRHDLATLTPVTEMQVKAEIARPAPFEVVPKGQPYRMHGAAWTGDSEVEKVEVSTDGGKTWAEAKLTGDASRFTWRLWEYTWQVPSQPGRRFVMARATDKRGQTQPSERDPDRRDAMINHLLPIEIEVR